jgi:hypothetical protein
MLITPCIRCLLPRCQYRLNQCSNRRTTRRDKGIILIAHIVSCCCRGAATTFANSVNPFLAVVRTAVRRLHHLLCASLEPKPNLDLDDSRAVVLDAHQAAGYTGGSVQCSLQHFVDASALVLTLTSDAKTGVQCPLQRPWCIDGACSRDPQPRSRGRCSPACAMPAATLGPQSSAAAGRI